MTQPMHDTLIFDFDGTLIDSAPGILATFSAVLSAAGIKPAVPLDERLIGPPLLPTMSKLTGHVEPEKLDILVEDFKRLYADLGVASTLAYPDAEATLKQLTACGKTLYLATNKRTQPTLALLEKFGWNHFFHRIYCIDSKNPPYADKTAMLHALLQDNHLRAAQCLYVGDTHGDWSASSANSIAFLAVAWGYEDLVAGGKYSICPSLATLADLCTLHGPS
jgi:phosphoglycolate phosphatase